MNVIFKKRSADGRTEVPLQNTRPTLTVEMLNDRLRQFEQQVTHLTQKIKVIELTR